MLALTPVRRIRGAVLKDLGLPEDILTFVNYPTRFDCPRRRGGAQGLGHRGPAAGGLRLAAVGLLGAQSRSGSAYRPHAEGAGQGQGGAHHRRLFRHRPGHRAQDGRGRRDDGHRRARRREARRGEEGDRRQGHSVVTIAADVSDRRRLRRSWSTDPRGRNTAASTSSSTTPGARSAARSRTRTTASTISSARCSSITSARCGSRSGCCRRWRAKRKRPHHQHLVDRRADQRAAFLGVRRLESRARRVLALRRVGVRRRRHRASRRSTCRWCGRR